MSRLVATASALSPTWLARLKLAYSICDTPPERVLAATVDAFACPRSDILAWLGPAIGPGSFEVGADVYHRFLAQWHAYGEKAVADCFVPHREERWLCDIYALARLQLDALGVTAVYGGGEDTCANWQNFYSFRRDGATGRMVSLVWRTD